MSRGPCRRGPPSGEDVKLVTAIIQPFKLDPVREALALAGVSGVTVTELRGYGHARGRTEIYRGAEYVVDFAPQMRIEVAVGDERVDAVVEAIGEAARTGKADDDRVFVVPLAQVVRIRTGEVGDDAL